ncbi:MAG: hypothetical protein P8N02_00015 [Actinomycetota bacterium]|nr:hypothetical protein [Actinomycetota bacterium]
MRIDGAALIDDLPDSEIDAYICTMRRLRSTPAGVVHGGQGMTDWPTIRGAI